MVRKILRSLPTLWTPKVTTTEEANDLSSMSLAKLIGSLMAHEINMERLGESTSKKKISMALKIEEPNIDEATVGESSDADSEEEAFLSRRLQRILDKKKHQQWRVVVGIVLRLGRKSRDMRRAVSSMPQHPRVPRYYHHHNLWTTAYSCKAWSRRCRCRHRLKLHYRPCCRRRPRLQL
ncbi:hypothetical protein Taro_050461 [Colocasia esculenta]|uniref:UBN2 domain-containing protein n=1 Tax=Colocasia esculenta TaxID=4460 RepID=A0A843XE21_COLES|nr:hypothetical protein [Colocasia esculenta]